MQTNTLSRLLEEANKIVARLSYEETCIKINDGATIIDVREESELNQNGMIKNAIHIPRGLIEFILSPDSPKNPSNINKDTIILVYCAGGYRSALAAKSLLELGFNNVFNIGGFDEWVNNGGEIQPKSNY
tara:strand:- start:527 stop:916 length:390 start_codon:yes stop_codon:yes gene_type:complete